MQDPTYHPIAKIIDAMAALSIVGTIAGWLPTIATVFSTVWFGIKIYESQTFRHWNNNRIMRSKARKIARLKAKEKILAAQILAMETVRSARVEAKEKIATAKTEATLDVVHDTVDEAISRL